MPPNRTKPFVVVLLLVFGSLLLFVGLVAPLAGYDLPHLQLPSYYAPTDDAYVNYYYPDTNWGQDQGLMAVKNIGESVETYRTYLKFYVAEVGPVLDMKLNLYITQVWDDPTIGIYKVTDDAWTEEAITWNNKPDVGARIDGTVNPIEGWWIVDITGYYDESQSNNDDYLSFAVMWESPSSTAAAGIAFYAKEAGGNMPHLTFTPGGNGNGDGDIFVCPYCGAVFYTQEELDQHIRDVHGITPPPDEFNPLKLVNVATVSGLICVAVGFVVRKKTRALL